MRWPKYWSFSLSISLSSEQPGLISIRMDWLDLLAVQGTIPMEKKCKKAKWLSGEALQIAVKRRDITLPTKVQKYGFSSSHVYIFESWIIKNAEHWRILLNCGTGEDSWESLGLQEIQPINPKGNLSWIFIGRSDAEAETPILWPPDAKHWLIWKDPDAGKDWTQEEKGTREDEMVGWYHRLNGHEFV